MSNEKQVVYWNEVAGPKWVKIGDAMDARLAGVSELLLARAAVRPGERVLDIGCGTGTTARPFAEAVAPGGRVVGIDISVPMLNVARARGGAVEYLEADAQIHDFGAQKFELLASRFGVMFFSDPVAAFANLRRAAAPGGRLCFACWAGLAENEHWLIPFEIARARVGDPAPRHPHAPGPMAFSDPAYVENILAGAGFSSIAVTPAAVAMRGETLEEETRIACLMGPAGALLDEKEADSETRREIEAEVMAAMARFVTDGGVAVPGTIHLVTAIV